MKQHRGCGPHIATVSYHLPASLETFPRSIIGMMLFAGVHNMATSHAGSEDELIRALVARVYTNIDRVFLATAVIVFAAVNVWPSRWTAVLCGTMMWYVYTQLVKAVRLLEPLRSR